MLELLVLAGLKPNVLEDEFIQRCPAQHLCWAHSSYFMVLRFCFFQLKKKDQMFRIIQFIVSALVNLLCF